MLKGALALFIDRLGLRPEVTRLTLHVARVDLYYAERGPAPGFHGGRTRCNAPNRTTVSAGPLVLELPLDATGPIYLESFEAPTGRVSEIRLVLSALEGFSNETPVQVQTEVTCADSHEQVVRFLPLTGAPFELTAGETTEVAGELDARTQVTPRADRDCGRPHHGPGKGGWGVADAGTHDGRGGEGGGDDGHGDDRDEGDDSDEGDGRDEGGDHDDGDGRDDDEGCGKDHRGDSSRHGGRCDGEGHSEDESEHGHHRGERDGGRGDDGECPRPRPPPHQEDCEARFTLSSTLLAKLPPLGCSFSGPAIDLDPLSSPTPYNPVLLSGESRRGVTVQISGGAAPVSTAVDELGRFSTLVPLASNSTNQLAVVAVDACGYTGPTATLTAVHDDVHPEGRGYPDPFLECGPVTLLLRSPDLMRGGADSVTLTLAAQQNLRAPAGLSIAASVPELARGRVAQVVYGAEQPQVTCSYAYVEASQAFALTGCTRMDGALPSLEPATTVTVSLPGISTFRGFSLRAELTSSAPCPGRPRLSGGKFFDRNGVPGEWLVVLDERLVPPGGVDSTARQLASQVAGTVLATFAGRPLGFALGSNRAGARTVAGDPAVRFVESNVEFRGSGISGPLLGTQWALDRMDQVPEQVATRDLRFRWPETLAPVTDRPRLFVVDTQARLSHTFFDRIPLAAKQQLPPFRTQCAFGGGTRSAHGTQVASAAAGQYGTGQAQMQSLVSVPALGDGGGACDYGTGTEVNAALGAVLGQSESGDIVNLSFGGSSLSGFIEMSVAALLDEGRVVVAAAGNEASAVIYPPANIPGVLAVGGTDEVDGRWALTNFGPQVRLHAPAINIYAASDTSDSATSNPFGTSLSSPLTAGVALHAVIDSTAQASRAFVDALVARLESEAVSVQRTGGAVDHLAIVRGRALERGSLAVAPADAVVLATAMETVGSSLFVGLSELSPTTASSSLVRIPLDASGFPVAGAVPARVRAPPVQNGVPVAEWCFALGAETQKAPPGILAGCWSKAGTQLVRYDEAGQAAWGPLDLPATDVPYRAATFADAAASVEAQAVLFNYQSGGMASPLWAGDKVAVGVLTGLSVFNTATVLAPPGMWIFGNDIAVECFAGPSCDAYVLSTAVVTSRPPDVLSDATLLVHKVQFNPTTFVLSAPVEVFRKRVVIPDPPGCFVQDVAIGYGAWGTAVVADRASFKVVYTIGNTAFEPLANECRISGTTYVATSPTSEVAWAPGEFATRLAWNRANNTALLVGAIEALLPQPFVAPRPAVWGTDRSLTRRMTWQPPERAGDVLLTDAYRGLVLESPPSGGLTLRWFDP